MAYRGHNVSVPLRAHPFVQTLYAAMLGQELGCAELSRKSGVKLGTIKAWRGINLNPRVDCIDGALRAVGLRLAVVPIDADAA